MTYSLLSTIRYEETEELDRPAGSHANECLTLVIDEERVVLWGKGEPNREKEGLIGYDTESLSYPISAAILSKLASAYRVDVEIWSEMGTLKGFFKKENITNFRQFYAKHVENDQSTTQKK